MDPSLGVPLHSIELPLHLTQLEGSYDTWRQCYEATRDNPYYGCLHEIKLCQNGGFKLLITDVWYEGFYTRSGNSIRASLVVGGGDLQGFAGLLAEDGSFTSQQFPGRYPFQNYVLSTDARSALEEDCAELDTRSWLPR